VGGFGHREVPLLTLYFYRSSKAKSGLRATVLALSAAGFGRRAIRSEDRVRWGVWLGRYICQRV